MRIIKNIKLPKVLLMLLFVLGSVNLSAQIYGPLLTDVWGGVNCVDNKGSVVYPLNYYTPNHCSPGCVGISLSQALHFYEWPKVGVDNSVYSENYNGTRFRHTAHFDGVEYDWANMLDEYKYKTSTDVERKAVGQLVYHVDVALEMDFEPSGSTSNVNRVPGIQQHFRFSGHYKEPGSYSGFWDRMKDNIKKGHPVQIAILDDDKDGVVDGRGPGHALIVDGFNESTGKFHLNWGWYNRNGINGWYDIEHAWDGTGGGYDKVTGAMFDFYPIPQISEITRLDTGNSFTVNWITSDKIVNDEYTIEQKVDGGSWEQLATTTNKSFTIDSPSGKVYQFRVKARTDGNYFANSWSEIVAFAVEGGYNGYASMDGSQAMFAYQTRDGKINFSDEYTFETWIRVKSGSSNGDVIMDKSGVFALEIASKTSSSYSVVFKANGNTLNSENSGKKITIDEWAHVAVSRSATSTKLFVNGELYDESTSDFKLPDSNNAFNVAERYHGGYSGRIVADFDQLRLSTIARYNSNFTPSQKVQFDVDSNTSCYLTFQNIPSFSYLEGHNGKYRFRFKDSSSNLSFRFEKSVWEYEETENELANEDLELIASLISIYPNPVVNNYLDVSVVENELINNRKIQFILLDLNGKKIMLSHVDKISSNQWRINLPPIEKGIYILQVDGGNFKMNRKLFIK